MKGNHCDILPSVKQICADYSHNDWRRNHKMGLKALGTHCDLDLGQDYIHFQLLIYYHFNGRFHFGLQEVSSAWIFIEVAG